MRPGAPRPASPFAARAGRLAALVVVQALSAVVPAGTVVAHGGEVGIEVIPRQVQAGGTVHIYGDELAPGDRVELSLLAADGPRPLGTFDVDSDGHLMEPVAVPHDLTPRVYEIQLTDGSDLTFSAYVTVVEGGGGSTESNAPAWPATGTIGTLILAAVLVGGLGWLATSRTRRR